MTGKTGTGKYEELLERCRHLEPVVTAVVHPCEASALAGAIEAGVKGLITPILVGPAAKIDEVARKSGIDLGNTRVDRCASQPRGGGQGRGAGSPGAGRAPDEREPAHRRTARCGRGAGRPACAPGVGISHVFIMDVPTYHKVLIITDAAINIAPTLEDKVDICQNAIDLAVSLGRATAEGRDSRRGGDGHVQDAGHY